MSDDHKKPLWAWILAPLIGLPVMYVLSAGPAQIILVRQVPVRTVDSHGRPFTPPPSMSCGAAYDCDLYSTIYAPTTVLAETPAAELLT